MSDQTQERIKFFIDLVCGLSGKDINTEWNNWEIVAKASPSYLPERLFEFCLGENMLNIIQNLENEGLERIVLNNYIWGSYVIFKEIKDINNQPIDLEDSVIFKLLKEGNFMRVNVLHPMFLCDQWLVAEYRGVKMGPKALSRSLGSLLGVDKKRISPNYTLNTGHTYFFYDKNKFLERRLAQLVEEMQFRGFETNFTELVDDKYDYHPDTFNKEWWNDWQPDEAALNINMERLHERLLQKSLNPNTKGWYKLFGYSVPDMNTVINVRTKGFLNYCKHCKSVNDETELLNSSRYCWNCCKKLGANDLVLFQINQVKKEVKQIKEESPTELIEWYNLKDYINELNEGSFTPDGINRNLGNINKFIQYRLRDKQPNLETAEEEYKNGYDDFDLEELCELINNFIKHISNKEEILGQLLIGFNNEDDLVFMKEYFNYELVGV